MKKHLLASLFLALAALSCSRKDDPKVDPSVNPIEVKYTAAGPYAVSSTTVRNSSGSDLYKIYYPTQLPSGCPVVTWGNGTGQDYTAYQKPLQHLASWGYIVIDNYDGDTAPGRTIVASAQYMVDQNSNPASMFYRKVDVDHIAAVGHSQGGVGVVNARTKANGRLIKTIVPLHMSPNLGGELTYNTANVDVPIFFISGTEDGLFSPLRVSQAAYNAVPAGVPAVMGIRLGAFHDAIRDTDKEQGYVTAWLEYQLKGNQEASQAFRGSSAEMQENPLWGNVGRKKL
jgi:dienelactone hydrolase